MLLYALALIGNAPLDTSTTSFDASEFAVESIWQQGYPVTPMPVPPPRRGLVWRKGQVIMQGFFAVTEYETMKFEDGPIEVDGSDEDAAELPMLGGGGQWKMAGERIDFGLELMFAFGWRANATAFTAGGGGAAVVVDVDSFTTELYGGPFANIFLGDAARVYASVGPLLQWASFDHESAFDAADGSGSGFGTGFYARTGFEFMLGGGTMLGLGVRWSESDIDFGSDGDLDIEGLQWAVTVSTGF